MLIKKVYAVKNSYHLSDGSLLIPNNYVENEIVKQSYIDEETFNLVVEDAKKLLGFVDNDGKPLPKNQLNKKQTQALEEFMADYFFLHEFSEDLPNSLEEIDNKIKELEARKQQIIFSEKNI